MSKKHDYNKDGEQDAKKGKYNPPGPKVPPGFDLLYHKSDKEIEKSEEYSAGWNNTRNQKKKS